MDKIKKYIERFFSSIRKNSRYNMYSDEILFLADNAKNDVFGTIATTFNYGYAKGYRAALAEIKKGGAVICR